MKTDNEQKQYLTREQIEHATAEEIQSNVKNMQEELNQLKDLEKTEEEKDRFRELIHLKFLCNSHINLLEFREMVHRGRKNNEEE